VLLFLKKYQISFRAVASFLKRPGATGKMMKWAEQVVRTLI